MKKELLAVLLLSAASLLCPKAQAQGRFRPGYVVQLTGDTLRGQVQQRGAVRAAVACAFRTAATAEPTEYHPAELRAYGFAEGDHYEARVTERLRNKREVVLRTLFLNVLAQGKAQLYSMRDKDDLTHFYLATSPDSVQELRQVRTAVPSTNQDQIVYETQYPFRAVLAEAFRDCPAVQHLLPSLVLSEGDLRRVVARYNACVAAPGAPALAPAVPGQQRSRVSFGVVGGLQNDRADFESSSAFSSGEFKGSGRPFGGVFMVLSTPALNHHLSLRLDALYEHLRYADKYVYGKETESPVTQQVTFNLNYLRLPLQVRYSLLRRRVTPYLMVGASYNYLLAYSAPTHTEFTVVNKVYASDQPALNDANVSRSDYGLLGGLGLTAQVLGGRSVGLEVQAQRSSGFLNRASTVTRLGVLLSLTLTK